MSQKVWKVHVEIHLRPWVKEDRECADFHKVYAYSTISLKKKPCIIYIIRENFRFKVTSLAKDKPTAKRPSYTTLK